MTEPRTQLVKQAPTDRSDGISSIAVVAIGVTAILNIFWVVAKYTTLPAGGSAPFLSQTMMRRDWMIATALILAGLSLASKRGLGLVVSLVALMWVLVEYVRWYFWTKRIWEASNWTRIPFPQTANLYGATAWNVVVQLIVAILVVWEAVMLVGLLKSSRRRDDSLAGGR